MNGTPEPTTGTPAEVLAALIHDWIKYMEMRLLSVRWEEAPEDVESLVARALTQTRRAGGETRGARELWESARVQLLATGDPALAEVVARVDADLDALLELLSWDRARLVASGPEVERLVRAPGRRLRDAYFVVTDEDEAGE